MPTGLIHLPRKAVVPVAFQASTGPSTTSNNFNAGLSRTLSHTAPAADGLAGIVFVVAYASNNSMTNRTASWGGVDMTEISTLQSGVVIASIWGLLNPPSGTQSIAAAVGSGSNAGRELWVMSASYVNVGSFGPGEGIASTSQTVLSNAGEMVVNAMGGAATTSGYNQTLRGGPTTITNLRALAGDAPGDSSVTFSVTGGAGRSAALRLLPL